MTQPRVGTSGAEPRESLRVALFTHDTFGLGHVRRSLHIIRALAARRPDASILLVTGSPAFQLFSSLPPNVDVIKIPTVVKTGAKAFHPSHLPIPTAEVTELRRALILEAVRGFGPDVFLVDNFPLGSRGELRSILQELRDSPCHTVLGLRDVLDTPEAIRADWNRQGIYDVLDRYFDRVLVYGMHDVFDVAVAYDLSSQVRSKVHYCGYVTAAESDARDHVNDLISPPFVLATGGGGGDAFPLLEAFAQSLGQLPAIPALIVTGPLMKDVLRERLAHVVNGRSDVTIRTYVPDLGRYLAKAAVVVSMCGYNTAAEIVASRARAVVVPRTWQYGEHSRRDSAGVEGEQLLRAQSLARRGLVDCLEPDQLTPERLAERVRARLQNGEPRDRSALDLRGRDRVVDHILELSGHGSGSHRAED